MPPHKSGLGRGLEALIPPAEQAVQGGGVREVELATIQPNPHQPRTRIRDQDLVELAASIESHGVIQPLIVTEEGDGYRLIAGERRWRAARLAGLTRVPVIVKDVVPSQMLELALVENIQRQDLNPLEEALAYRQLIDEFGLTHEELGRRVGKSRPTISNSLRLLDAAEAVKEALLNGKVSEGHARALLALESKEAQQSALRIVLRRGLSVRQTEELVRRRLSTEPRPKRAAPPPELEALETQFRDALNTRVRLAHKKEGGGRLIVYYYSDEDLENLYHRIVGV